MFKVHSVSTELQQVYMSTDFSVIDFTVFSLQGFYIVTVTMGTQSCYGMKMITAQGELNILCV